MRELSLVFGIKAYPFHKVRDKEEFAADSIKILCVRANSRKVTS